MPKVYDPILCMMVDKPATRTTDASAIANRYINAIMSENAKMAEQFVRQAEQDNDISDADLSAIYKAYNSKHGKKFHDSGIRNTTDAANLKELKDDYGRLKNASSIIGNIYSLSSSTKSAILKAIESGMREIDTRIDQAYMK